MYRSLAYMGDMDDATLAEKTKTVKRKSKKTEGARRPNAGAAFLNSKLSRPVQCLHTAFLDDALSLYALLMQGRTHRTFEDALCRGENFAYWPRAGLLKSSFVFCCPDSHPT